MESRRNRACSRREVSSHVNVHLSTCDYTALINIVAAPRGAVVALRARRLNFKQVIRMGREANILG